MKLTMYMTFASQTLTLQTLIPWRWQYTEHLPHRLSSHEVDNVHDVCPTDFHPMKLTMYRTFASQTLIAWSWQYTEVLPHRLSSHEVDNVQDFCLTDSHRMKLTIYRTFASQTLIPWSWQYTELLSHRLSPRRLSPHEVDNTQKFCLTDTHSADSHPMKLTIHRSFASQTLTLQTLTPWSWQYTEVLPHRLSLCRLSPHEVDNEHDVCLTDSCPADSHPMKLTIHRSFASQTLTLQTLIPWSWQWTWHLPDRLSPCRLSPHEVDNIQIFAPQHLHEARELGVTFSAVHHTMLWYPQDTIYSAGWQYMVHVLTPCESYSSWTACEIHGLTLHHCFRGLHGTRRQGEPTHSNPGMNQHLRRKAWKDMFIPSPSFRTYARAPLEFMWLPDRKLSENRSRNVPSLWSLRTLLQCSRLANP